jgi:ergothioneine biosynthesis protein EgtB
MERGKSDGGNVSGVDRDEVLRRYSQVRARTEALVEPLSAEDMLVQSMPDASPSKWHLAHTTWFFEEFVLARFEPGHKWQDERWRVLFNSYYEAAGPRHPRPARGVLSRPALAEVRAWRARIDERMTALLRTAGPEALAVALLGTHHEEQHQELILTDITHALAQNSLRPAYARADHAPPSATAPPLEWVEIGEQLASMGHDGRGFAFDNEGPRHRVFVERCRIASRLVTNAEYARFVDDGGYERPELWLSDGWAAVREHGWSAPLYWEAPETSRQAFSLRGVQPLDLAAPVTHVSFFEADAYARWAGHRLPTEAEWEVAAATAPVDGNFLESRRLEAAPAGARGPGGLCQMFGDAWEWTASAYLPYPKFRTAEGALGEYNGKFMSGQMVLRGGSCLSPREHLRPSYRNFFPPWTRWQMSGVRLASDA